MKKSTKRVGFPADLDDIDPAIVKKYDPQSEEVSDQGENKEEEEEEAVDPDLEELKDIASTKKARTPGRPGGKVGATRKQKEEDNDSDSDEEDEEYDRNREEIDSYEGYEDRDDDY